MMNTAGKRRVFLPGGSPAELGALERLFAPRLRPAYVAPEQARGGQTDVRSDLFSLGCVLYHLATGVNPFARRETLATLLAIAGEEPQPPRALAPELPDALSELIAALLSKDPAGRPQWARDVIERIRGIERELAAKSSNASATDDADRIESPPPPSLGRGGGPVDRPDLAGLGLRQAEGRVATNGFYREFSQAAINS